MMSSSNTFHVFSYTSIHILFTNNFLDNCGDMYLDNKKCFPFFRFSSISIRKKEIYFSKKKLSKIAGMTSQMLPICVLF